MILAKCPLRISLVGGSTDSDAFLTKYKKGSVISFTPNLYTFVTIHKNNIKKYVINYSNKECEQNPNNIKNDIIRECIKFFNTPFCTITFNSNILSSGSGLASSSSYTIAIIKAISIFQNINLTDTEICNLAFEIEKKINPLAGQQDIFGCGIGNFKRIDFYNNSPQTYKFLDVSFITNNYEMYLLNTNIVRNSTNVLKTIDIDKSYPLLNIVDQFETSILNKDVSNFFNLFNEGWNIKKTTSNEIIGNENLLFLDSFLSNLECVKGIKLCGAGGGGYFFLFVDKKERNYFNEIVENKLKDNILININIDSKGIQGTKIWINK